MTHLLVFGQSASASVSPWWRFNNSSFLMTGSKSTGCPTLIFPPLQPISLFCGFFWNLTASDSDPSPPSLWRRCHFSVGNFRVYTETLPSRAPDQNTLLRKLASSTPGRHSYPVTVSINKCKQIFLGNTLEVHLYDTKKSIWTDFPSWTKY